MAEVLSLNDNTTSYIAWGTKNRAGNWAALSLLRISLIAINENLLVNEVLR